MTPSSPKQQPQPSSVLTLQQFTAPCPKMLGKLETPSWEIQPFFAILLFSPAQGQLCLYYFLRSHKFQISKVLEALNNGRVSHLTHWTSGELLHCGTNVTQLSDINCNLCQHTHTHTHPAKTDMAKYQLCVAAPLKIMLFSYTYIP